MRHLNLILPCLLALFVFAACSQADPAQCACLNQAQKVNRLTAVIWSSNATHKDTILLRAALVKKDLLCNKIKERAPEALQDLKKVCLQ